MFVGPYGITELKAETINTTAINLNWTKPAEYRDDYKYRVATSGCAYKNNTLEQETIQISGLDPGTNCTFCVSVMAANGIEGQTVCTSQYTSTTQLPFLVFFVRLSLLTCFNPLFSHHINRARDSKAHYLRSFE